MFFFVFFPPKHSLTIPKLNMSIKLEEQPKLPNRHRALPGLAGNTIPASDSLEVLRLHEGLINPQNQLLFTVADKDPPAVLLSACLYLSSAVEAKTVYATRP